MAQSAQEGDTRPIMEDCGCKTPGPNTWWCSECQVPLCDICWEGQAAHRANAFYSKNHEKTTLDLANIINSILCPEMYREEQINRRNDGHKTKWFGVFEDDESGPYFEDFGRYNRLLAGMRPDQYPSLSSFVGETGAGKSTLISALVKIKALGDSDLSQIPVMGTQNCIPTSGEVHLFADPHSCDETRPYFYADCEGFKGGNTLPLTCKDRKEITIWETIWGKNGQSGGPKKSQNGRVNGLLKICTRGSCLPFQIQAIESDFIKLINWADKVFEKSINQPMLPRAIVIVNAHESEDKAFDNWNVNAMTDYVLNRLEDCVDKDAGLKGLAEHWASLGTPVNTLKGLLLRYYGNVRVICIPYARRSPRLIKQQYEKLYKELEESSEAAKGSRTRAGLLMTNEELGYYLENAFTHFSEEPEAPFDFLKAAFLRKPIPETLKSHIVRLAIVMMKLHLPCDGKEIFKKMGRVIASCIFLESKRSHLPQAGIISKYLPLCKWAQEEFYRNHWPCEWTNHVGQRCANVSNGHVKGHQGSDGKVLAVGEFQSSFSNSQAGDFLDSIQVEYQDINVTFDFETFNIKDPKDKLLAAATFHRNRILQEFVNHHAHHLPEVRYLGSHHTCFGCLFHTPAHTLYCGHVLCDLCIENYAKIRSNNHLEIENCPLCPSFEIPWGDTWKIHLESPFSGLRILSLDGGGIRGIVQLTILDLLEKKIDLDIPIQNFFDLIVGTSAGGIIALGLGAKNMSVDAYKQHFQKLCKLAFAKRSGTGIPIIGDIIASQFHSKYKSKDLEDVLRRTFGDDPLFGGKQTPQSPGRVKVAVTSTSSNGYAYIHANYNRPQAGDQAPYVFLRGESDEQELKIWEAARASSAAPLYFKPFTHKKTGHTFNDGALRYNNPVEVADEERKLLWPHLKDNPPTLLLSIGTGYDSTVKVKKDQQGPMPTPGLLGLSKRLLQIAQDQFAANLDCEVVWDRFLASVKRPQQDTTRNYRRLNFDHHEGLPKLDEVNEMRSLEIRTRKHFSGDNLISEVAETLIASLFYFEIVSLKPDSHDHRLWKCEGLILCSLPRGSKQLKKLRKRLRLNWLHSGSKGAFILCPAGTDDWHIPEPYPHFFEKIDDDSEFKLPLQFTVVAKKPSEIYLARSPDSKNHSLISGFPRCIIPWDPPPKRLRSIGFAEDNPYDE